MSRLVGYLRRSVATDDDGASLNGQREAILAWARANGHEVVGFEVDDGVSGTKGDGERPGLAAVLDAVTTGAVQGVIVHRTDRLARSLMLSELVCAKVWASNGAVYSATQGEVQRDNPEDPTVRFLRQVLAAVSELERSLVVARMQGGRRRRAATGRFMGGHRPIGWRVDSDGTLVADRPEQRKLQQIRQMRDEGASIRTIARTVGLARETTRVLLKRQQAAGQENGRPR